MLPPCLSVTPLLSCPPPRSAPGRPRGGGGPRGQAEGPHAAQPHLQGLGGQARRRHHLVPRRRDPGDRRVRQGRRNRHNHPPPHPTSPHPPTPHRITAMFQQSESQNNAHLCLSTIPSQEKACLEHFCKKSSSLSLFLSVCPTSPTPPPPFYLTPPSSPAPPPACPPPCSL